MKKICALLLSCLLLLSACSLQPGSSEAGTQTPVQTDAPGTGSNESVTEPSVAPEPVRKELIVWTFGTEEELTKSLCARFMMDNPAIAETYSITVKPVNAEDLITRVREATDTSYAEGVLPDVEAMPDLFFFYSDDYEMLRKINLLGAVPEEMAAKLEKTVDAAALAAASDEAGLYAYPAALENTMLLYYDKSVISEIKDLASVIRQCEENDRCFYMGTETTMFPALLFLSCGLTYDADILPDGSIASVSCDYYTEAGLHAAKLMQSLMSMKAFRGIEGSPVLSFAYDQEKAGAIIADSCQTQDLKVMLQDNYGVAALPTILDGKEERAALTRGTYTMIGVSPKKDEAGLAVCHKLAEFLTSDEGQLDRYNTAGTLPVSTSVLAGKEIRKDETASALMAQMPNVIRKVKTSEGYVEAMNRFTSQLIKGGSEIKTARLQQLLDELSAYLMADGAVKVPASPSTNN